MPHHNPSQESTETSLEFMAYVCSEMQYKFWTHIYRQTHTHTHECQLIQLITGGIKVPDTSKWQNKHNAHHHKVPQQNHYTAINPAFI